MKNITSLTELAAVATRGIQQEDGKPLSVDIDDIVSKAQVRKRFKNLEELAESLKLDGQINAINVAPKNKDGKYVILKGERRWRAGKIAKLKQMKIVIDTRMQDDLDRTAEELAENIQRENLTPFEIADGLSQFKEAGWTNGQISKRVSKTPAFVSLYLSLLSIPSFIRALNDEDVTNDAETLYNLSRIHDLAPQRAIEIVALAKEEKSLSRTATRAILKELTADDGKERGKRGPQAKESKIKPNSSDDSKSAADKALNASQGKPDASSASSESGSTASSQESTAKELDKSAKMNSPAAQDAETQTTVASKPNDAHKKPSQPSVLKNVSFKAVTPGQIILAVSVSIDGVVTNAVVMNDRISLKDGSVWVKTDAGNVTEVLAEQITLRGVQATD
ncbi:MAG: ParB/RepB/Spo0J family partition protein [Comamonas sp.]|jgi:ParB family chromosome partitioning protein|uniref:ParB/RepB/Spo0J family partition protein n=1 Tax=Comamonas TaxID=283 RepID=UPI00069AADB6|nr:ParB/RepB/Spo0J family partition protein [Comamonas thiooxydans]UBQ44438.1 ParB/RepB/Spo0J family partition protein [Comamonas thiooxydans]